MIHVSVATEDIDVFRFLWVDDIHRDLPQMVVLRFTRVLFGVSRPFLLNATIRYHINPGFAEKILQSIYVDDIVSKVDNVNQAYNCTPRQKHILRGGGFNLSKLISISKQIQ